MRKIKEWLSDSYIMKKVIAYAVIFLFLLVVALLASYNLDMVFTGGKTSLSLGVCLRGLLSPRPRQFFIILMTAAGLLIFYMAFIDARGGANGGGSQRITPSIKIPQAAGNGQHGNARFLTSSEVHRAFAHCNNRDIVSLNANGNIEAGGLYLGESKTGDAHYFIDDDSHAVVVGKTGSGKTRCLVLQTLCMLALSGESMIVSDPKSELYIYSKELLAKLDYNVVVLDFISFRKSNQYNFLQPIIDAVNIGDIPLAVTRTNDLVAALVSSDRTNESIWVDGERSVIACAIMAVVYDNQAEPQYQNLTNVYSFLANMCKPNAMNILPLARYIATLPDTHPAKSLVDISALAPSKMRGSFYTSALTTLKFFTSPDIYDMTRFTDFDIYNTSKVKTAVFIVLPDYKSTYYSVATLFISQQYQMLRDEGYKQGGRLDRRVNYLLEEAGNFTKIPDFTKHITVGRGCGVRYFLFLQDFHQLHKVYGDDDSKIIRSNCETWIYLKSLDGDTLKELSARLGNYTIKAPSVSTSKNGGSSSYSFASRELLNTSELSMIARPYQLVIHDGQKSVMYSPDIAKTVFNDILGMGTRAHNKILFNARNGEREEREKLQLEDICIWKPWQRRMPQ